MTELIISRPTKCGTCCVIVIGCTLYTYSAKKKLIFIPNRRLKYSFTHLYVIRAFFPMWSNVFHSGDGKITPENDVSSINCSDTVIKMQMLMSQHNTERFKSECIYMRMEKVMITTTAYICITKRRIFSFAKIACFDIHSTHSITSNIC